MIILFEKNYVLLKFIITMPQISRFYGIIILMNYLDHIPPHFHAIYNEYEIVVNIDDGEVKGVMPARALRIVLEWWELNKAALNDRWEKSRLGLPLEKIEPLK